MSFAAHTYRLHRWLGWVVGVQVLVWVLGGAVFALLPFDDWVKQKNTVPAPKPVLPAGWGAALAPTLAALDGPAQALTAVATPQGVALRVQRAGQPPLLLPADGRPWVAPDAAAVARFAATLHTGGAAVQQVQRVAQAPQRLGIVNEVPGRSDLWRVDYADAAGTRAYFDGPTGQFLAARTDAWVWYDFFFRLHVMDYSGGEDFNNTLLRVAAVLALGLVLAGTVLGLRAAWRQLRRRRA